MDLSSKLKSCGDLVTILRGLRESGQVVVFTNGCFDLLHAGHVRYLAAARQEGDILVVGLNSDRSVRDIKGDTRPILRESERAEVLAGLAAVNYIVLFDEPDPLRLITALAPDVLVKGGDWPEEAIIGAQVVRDRGGRVVRMPTVEGASTSAIIARILERCRD
ncbi:MAG TPA: D-glycero-beta-D-manno-heptose 1-phosphate adenylyltransferase [Desulfobacterales bacterium]|nr:D-glycero-beta-D-manno-heptose 1-phosphate adenylyltransferase [Desulfobacterales bacterium]